MTDEQDQTQDVIRLLRRIKAQDELLVAYRVGRTRLPERLFAELDKTRAWADQIAEKYK